MKTNVNIYEEENRLVITAQDHNNCLLFDESSTINGQIFQDGGRVSGFISFFNKWS